MITNAQKTILHVAAQELGLAREYYEAILQEAGGVTSSKDLDTAGFERAIRRMEELGFVNTARKRPASKPKATPSPKQLAFIQVLFRQIGWTEAERQRGFCQRQTGKAWPQTREEANRVIEGLKAMLKRQAAAQEAKNEGS